MEAEKALGVPQEEEYAEAEVFFKGRAMSPACDKENAGNLAQVTSILPKSPSSIMSGKKRPKPLEMLLAAKSLSMQASSPSSQMNSRIRDSWVFAESPSGNSPLKALRSSEERLTVAGKGMSPRSKVRDSILAFHDMSPLASTPTTADDRVEAVDRAEAVGPALQCFSKGLLATHSSRVSTPSAEPADVQAQDHPPTVPNASAVCASEDRSAKGSTSTAEQAAAFARGDEQDTGTGKNKKKPRESIMWIKSLTNKQAKPICGITLEEAFEDNLMLPEEEEMGSGDELEREATAAIAASEGLHGGNGATGAGSVKEGMCSKLKPPSQSVARTWGSGDTFGSRWGPSTFVPMSCNSMAYEEDEDDEDENEEEEDEEEERDEGDCVAVDERCKGRASEENGEKAAEEEATEVAKKAAGVGTVGERMLQVGPGMVIEVAQEKEGRSAQARNKNTNMNFSNELDFLAQSWYSNIL